MKNAIAFERQPRTMQRHGYTNGERAFKPIRLRALLVARSIAHADLAAAIRQSNGRALSRTALSFLMNYGDWPTTTPKELIRKQVERFLADHGVGVEELIDIWDADDAARSNLNQRYAHGHHAPAKREPAPKELIDIPEKEMLTPAARKHFQIFRDPFGIDDVRGPDDIFLAADQRYIREAMYQTAKNGGFVAIIGESGAGKSTLRKDLVSRVQKEGAPILFIRVKAIDKKKLTARMVCQAILADLAPHESAPQSLELLTRKVERLLLESYKGGNRHVLLIEEAHELLPLALKHLRQFYELEVGYVKLVSILLIGQPELKNLLDERQHFELREVIRRIEVAELLPLDSNVRDYLALKFDRAGKKNLDEIFTEDAFNAIITRLTRDDVRGRISMVYPLVVNNMVSRALNLAASIGEPRISAEVVREV